MKRVVTVLIILVLIAATAAAHSMKTMSFSREISDKASVIYSAYTDDNWETVSQNLNDLSDIWQKNRLWACMTLSTNQVDEIEVSLKQSIEYSKIQAKPDFIGEFRMFSSLVEHIPMQESFSLGELL